MTLRRNPVVARLRPLFALALLAPLGGCNLIVLDPAGDIARQQAHLVMMATGLMLLIILPVMGLTALFAWKYRAGNAEAEYAPDWHHSTGLELIIWSAPLLIIIALGSITWVGTHQLDPYRPVDRITEDKPLVAGVKPLEIDVVALDWKWLFIYPEQGIASVNELAVPADRPITFRITGATVMNSFYVPALAGQIYAMPGMETKLHAVLNQPIDSEGFSANYSGAGFSQMRFAFRGMTPGDFAAWAAKVKQDGTGSLSRAAYLQLEKPTIAEPVHHYAAVDGGLFSAVVNLCVTPGKMCASQMMAIDAAGGTGRAGAYNLEQLNYDKYGREYATPATSYHAAAGARTYVRAMCAPKQPAPRVAVQAAPHIADAAQDPNVPLHGAGLTPPENIAPAPILLRPSAPHLAFTQ